MLIFTEVTVDIRYSIPVFRTECYSLSAMPFQQCHIDQVISLKCTVCQSSRQTAIISWIWNCICRIGRLGTPVSSFIIQIYNTGEFGMTFIIKSFRNKTAGIKYCDLLLRHSAVIHQTTKQGKRQMRRSIQLLTIFMGESIILINLDSNSFSFLISTLPLIMLLIEINKKGFPGCLFFFLSGQGQERLV